MTTDIFLDIAQVDELTGIKRGSTVNGRKLSKYQLQIEFLRNRGIAFIANARGRPIVVRSVIEGASRNWDEPSRQLKVKQWQPGVIGK